MYLSSAQHLARVGAHAACITVLDLQNCTQQGRLLGTPRVAFITIETSLYLHAHGQVYGFDPGFRHRKLPKS